MNIFLNTEIANKYDSYYQTELGKQIDTIEKEVIAELLTAIPKEKMLDLGCGTGHWTEFLIKKGFQLTGVDISESMLNIAKDKNLAADFLWANSENLPFEDESFNSIVSITMLEFVENLDKVIQEIYRVLKRGGSMVIGCINADSIIGKNKDTDKVFKNANLLSVSDIELKFKQFKLVQLNQGVYLNETYAIMDNSNGLNTIPPVFIGALFQKI
jgi:ubiquinone/menaquinone biosynthesis C-methylase UbiE